MSAVKPFLMADMTRKASGNAREPDGGTPGAIYLFTAQ
jgi:hypothetical protein